jgi:hypothetical protein
MSLILEGKIRARHIACAATLALLSLLEAANAATTNFFLGEAVKFAALAGSSINNTGQTIVIGRIGLAPGTNVVGFPRSAVQVNTRSATNAQFDLAAAYNEIASRTNAVPLPASGPVTPGFYRASSLTIPPGGLFLDSQGNPAALYVFQIDSTLTVPADSGVFLTGAARAARVFWQVGDSVNIGANSRMSGFIMANQSITLGNRATLDGNALARNGDVILDRNVIALPVGGTTNDAPLDVAVLTTHLFQSANGPLRTAGSRLQCWHEHQCLPRRCRFYSRIARRCPRLQRVGQHEQSDSGLTIFRWPPVKVSISSSNTIARAANPSRNRSIRQRSRAQVPQAGRPYFFHRSGAVGPGESNAHRIHGGGWQAVPRPIP